MGKMFVEITYSGDKPDVSDIGIAMLSNPSTEHIEHIEEVYI